MTAPHTVWPGHARSGQRTLGNAKPLAANTGRGGVSAQLSLLSTGATSSLRRQLRSAVASALPRAFLPTPVLRRDMKKNRGGTAAPPRKVCK